MTKLNTSIRAKALKVYTRFGSDATFLGIVIDSREPHPAKTPSLICCSFDPDSKLSVVRLVAPRNKPSLSVSTPAGTVNEVRLMHPPKAMDPIFVTLLMPVTCCRFPQLSKARSSIVLTLLGMLIDFNAEHPAKAPFGREVIGT